MITPAHVPYLEGQVRVVDELTQASEQLLTCTAGRRARLQHHTRADGDGDDA